MKYFALILCSLMFLESPSSMADNSIEQKVLSGLDDIYNLNFESARSKFRSLQATYPDDLRGYFYESLLYFYDALPTRREEPYNEFMSRSQAVIDKAEEMIDKNEKNFDAVYYKGLSHSYRSLLMLSLNKDLLEAASDGNEGYRTLMQLVKEKPDYYDAYMGLGLYKIALGFVPDKFKWLLSLIGFEGNIDDGRDYLYKSMNNGKYTRIDSKVFLSVFSLNEREQDDNKSIELSAQLVKDYPGSSVFKVFHAGLLLQYGKTGEAIALAEEALAGNNGSLQGEIIKSASAVLGTAYFRQNQFQTAAMHMETHMQYANSGDRLNVYVFTLGVMYEIMGDRNKAIETYRKVREDFVNERDGELDKMFYRYSREGIKSPLRQYDKDLIFAMNLRESGKVRESIESYEGLIAKGAHLQSGLEDDMIKLYYNLGLCYHYVRNYSRSEELFRKCIALKPETETWLVPHSYFELGKLYYENGNRSASREMFEKIEDYDDYDFESFLEMRIANYLSKN